MARHPDRSFVMQDHTLTFRVEGRGTVTQSLPMRRLASAASRQA